MSKSLHSQSLPLHNLWPEKVNFQGGSNRQQFRMGSDSEQTVKGGLGPERHRRPKWLFLSQTGTLIALISNHWHQVLTCWDENWTIIRRMDKGSYLALSSTENRHSIDPDLLCTVFSAPSPFVNDFLPHSACFHFVSGSSAWPISKSQIRDTGRQIYPQAGLEQVANLF